MARPSKSYRVQSEGWVRWEDLPSEIQCGLIWGWQWWGPSTEADTLRLVGRVVNGEGIGSALQGEEPRWLVQGLQFLFPDVHQDALLVAVGIFLNWEAKRVRRAWTSELKFGRIAKHEIKRLTESPNLFGSVQVPSNDPAHDRPDDLLGMPIFGWRNHPSLGGLFGEEPSWGFFTREVRVMGIPCWKAILKDEKGRAHLAYRIDWPSGVYHSVHIAHPPFGLDLALKTAPWVKLVETRTSKPAGSVKLAVCEINEFMHLRMA